eukprot:703083_1
MDSRGLGAYGLRVEAGIYGIFDGSLFTIDDTTDGNLHNLAGITSTPNKCFFNLKFVYHSSPIHLIALPSFDSASLSGQLNVFLKNIFPSYFIDFEYDGFECVKLYHVCWICTITSWIELDKKR